MQVSFGKKIPIALGQIQNLRTGQFEPATIYKIDCKDQSDYIETRRNMASWHFSLAFYENMKSKFVINQLYHQDNDSTFYELQNQNHETLGRIQIDEQRPNIFTLEWFDTKRDKEYKYVGQTLLATITKKILANFGKCIIVDSAEDDALPFYIEKCGFEELTKDRLYMGQEQMQDFIQKTEKKTNGCIIDLTN